MIDAGERQVFDGRAGQVGQRQPLGIGGAQLAGRDGVEDRAQRASEAPGAGSMRRRRVQARLVDSTETSFLELRAVHAVPWPIL